MTDRVPVDRDELRSQLAFVLSQAGAQIYINARSKDLKIRALAFSQLAGKVVERLSSLEITSRSGDRGNPFRDIGGGPDAPPAKS